MSSLGCILYFRGIASLQQRRTDIRERLDSFVHAQSGQFERGNVLANANPALTQNIAGVDAFRH